jgi:hypothetical protein
MMKPKDRDFVETVDGQFFCVVGYLHPPQGYTAYLKYIPSQDGRWGRGTRRYTRILPYYHVSQVENTYSYLKTNFPDYIFDCPVRGITTSFVPLQKVAKYYDPYTVLNSINENGPRDPLEKKLLTLVEIFSHNIGSSDCFGVTGSILIGIHNPLFSDIDVIVYGSEASRKLKKAMVSLAGQGGPIRPLSNLEKEKRCRERVGKFPLEINQLRRISETWWNYAYFEGTYFSAHPTRTSEEVTESYEDNTYHRLGEVKGVATVQEDSESMFLPAIYKIGALEGEGTVKIDRLVSFEVLYCGAFKKGDVVEFRGALEEVKGRSPGYQVVIGGAGSPNGYIKWGCYSE